MRSIKRTLKVNLRNIAEYIKGISTLNDNANRWLVDNFYIIDKETRYAVHMLQEIKSKQQMDCLIDMREYLVECDFSVTTKNFEEFLIGWSQPSGTLYWNTPLFLKIALLYELNQSIFGDFKNREKRIADIIKELKTISSKDFTELLIKNGEVEKILESDPHGIYPKMDNQSKAYLRYRLEHQAKKKGISDRSYAKRILRRAKNEGEHIGKYLMKKIPSNGKIWLWIPFVIAGLSTALLVYLTKNIPAAIACFFLIASFAKKLLRLIITRLVKPGVILKLNVQKYKHEQSKTAVCITCLIMSNEDINSLCQRLSDIYFDSTSTIDTSYGILADFAENDCESTEDDRLLANYLFKKIEELNNLYGQHFFCALRKRKYSKTQNKYMGFERKRGAVLAFAHSIDSDNFDSFYGLNLDIVRHSNYMITLDSDSQPIYGCIPKLIGAMLYPLNRAIVENGRLVSGYSIMQPGVITMLESYIKTPFSRTCAACGGTDIYSRPISEFYSDMFGKSVFFGKGIIDVKAFLQTTSKLPCEKILSHDILEGELAGCAGVSDAVIGDCIPQTVISYYNRQHRWVRGDAQNAAFLFDSGFDSVAKYKLLDNVLSHLSPLFSTILLILAFISEYRYLFLSIWAAELWIDRVWEIVLLLSPSNIKNITIRFFCSINNPLLQIFYRMLYSLSMLVYTAYINTTATILGLYRRFISKKNLLSWQTAMHAQQKKVKGISQYLSAMWLSLFLGVSMFFLGNIAAAVFGVICITSPFIAYELSQTRKSRNSPELSRQKTVLSYIKKGWLYYEELVNEQSSYLPPDNFQLMPLGIKAMRTSPTNIGLYLLCVLAARDHELIDTEQMLSRLAKTIETVEKMEKYKGHIYNWYDIENMSVLLSYISTVDSGNLLACLLTLSCGLDDYICENEKINNKISRLKERINVLAMSMDFSFLYNKSKKLFSIGYDTLAAKQDGSFYDLYSSEMKITSFLTISLGLVEKEHWQKLARPIVKKDRFHGTASWSGTMFEYLMPCLFLKTFPGSLDYESVMFAIYCQKKAVKDIPWGISESAFSNLDALLNYQYKAFGVKGIAFARESTNRYVISPYSSMLTLPFCARSAIANLSKIQRLGGMGRYGFYEAIDYGRVAKKENMQMIMCYMSHHIGMSMLAATNYLKKNIMPERLFRIPCIKANSYMLEQRVDISPVAVGGTDGIYSGTKPPIPRSASLKDSGRPNPITPCCDLISVGDISLLATNVGACTLMYKGRDINSFSGDLIQSPRGLFAFFGSRKTVSMSYAPFYNSHKYKYVKCANGVVYHCKTKDISCRFNISLTEVGSFAVSVTVTNLTSKEIEDDLFLYMPLALANRTDYMSHKTFSSLFITSEYNKTKNILSYSRRTRKLYDVGCSIAIGFSDGQAFDFQIKRDKAAPMFERLYAEDQREYFFDNETGDTVDSVMAISRKLLIPAKGKKGLLFFIATGQDTQQAKDCLERSKNIHFEHQRDSKSLTAAKVSENKITSAILNAIHFSARTNKVRAAALQRVEKPISDLWRHGISGDYPIILFELTEQTDLFTLKSFVSCAVKLFLMGEKFDFIVVCHDHGTYMRPIYNSVVTAVIQTGGDAFVQSENKRIHILEQDILKDEMDLLKAVCSIYSKNDELIDFDITLVKDQFKPRRLYRSQPLQSQKVSDALELEGGYFKGEGFVITKQGATTPPWSMILANTVFGTLMSERSLGFSYYFNSRENKLSPWASDMYSDNNGERVLLEISDKTYDLFAGGLTTLHKGMVEKHCICGKVQVHARVFVAQDKNIKAISLDIDMPKNIKNAKLIHMIEPIMGVDNNVKGRLSVSCKDNIALFSNPINTAFKSSGYLYCKDKHMKYTVSCKEQFFNRMRSTYCSCNTLIVGKLDLQGGRKQVELLLGAANTVEKCRNEIDEFNKSGFNKELERALATVCSALPQIKISGENKELDTLFNGFLTYQIIYSRLFSRCGFYQCSGAYGFRDQLQDCMNLAIFDASYLKEQILLCAAHQFEEGDVMHWWHPTLGDAVDKGVRTTCSDDYMWLPFALVRYLDITGDYSLLEEKVQFIRAAPLAPGEDERYFQPEFGEKGSIYEHCKRAVLNFFKRISGRGLAFIGSCDWNDGMSEVGSGGKGESVWMSIFGELVIRDFSKVALYKHDMELLKEIEQTRNRLISGVENHAYDGQWYRRAYYDDMTPLGSKESCECKIDLLPQSFAAMAGVYDKKRVASGLEEAYQRLTDKENMLIRLFDPPFVNTHKNPGYIKAYGAGIRENGGQYTHAAVWFAMANLKFGKITRGIEQMNMINPINHYLDKKHRYIYLNEPYVLSADVYTTPLHKGRGGWSWYTGAAGWYFRMVCEDFLGLRKEGDRLYVKPCCAMEYKVQTIIAATPISIEIEKGDKYLCKVNDRECDYIILDGKPKKVKIKSIGNFF